MIKNKIILGMCKAVLYLVKKDRTLLKWFCKELIKDIDIRDLANLDLGIRDLIRGK